jgi:hypothetical protein
VQKFCRELNAFKADKRGNVTILSGLALTLLMAFASLGAEYGAGLLLQSENQRIADAAAFIASTYCGANSACSTAATLNTASAIAQNIGALNGIPGADVTSTVVNSPSGASGAEALQIQVSTTKLLMITPIEGAPGSLSLTAFSYGQIGQSASAAACVIALSAGGGNAYSGAGGLAVSGGAFLNAPNCGVATNNTITAANCSGGTPWLTAKTFSYNSSSAPTPTRAGGSNCGSAWMSPTTGTKAPVTDPLASLVGITTAQARVLGTVAPLTSPAAPTVTAPTAPTVTVPTGSGGTTWPAALTNLGWWPTNTLTDPTTHCSASFNSGASVWTISGCNAGAYNISSAITNGPGLSFMPSGSSSAVYNFNYSVSTSGTTTFGPGTYNFKYAVSLGGGSTTNFANGGAGAFNFAAGLTVGGGSTVTFGAGTFAFAGSLNLAGSQATFGAGTFGVTGSLTVSSATTFGGGTFNIGQNLITSCCNTISFGGGSTGNTFNIGGNATIAGGSTTFGAGTVNVVGNLALSGTTTFQGNAFNIGGNLTTGGSGATNFDSAGSNGTYNVGGNVGLSGAGASFGAGTFNFVKGLTTSGGGANTFGAGTFNFGAPTSGSTCTGSAYYSICNNSSGTLTFGVGTFNFSSGIYSGGGTTISMGSGSSGNSYEIGSGSDNNAFNYGGGSGATLGDATCGACVFQFNGNIVTGGGSYISLGAATQHDIDGSMNLQGAMTLGSGVYTLTGYFAAGATSGGNVNGVGVAGSGVTIVYGGAYPGTFSPSSPSCAGAGFCIGAGYGTVNLTAPTSGTYNQLVVVGPSVASGITAGALFTAGASSTLLSGALYMPNGQIYMNGGASAANVTGGCLEIVGSIIQVTQGASAATACSALNGTTGTASAIPAGIVQ